MKLLQIVLMSCHQADVLLGKYKTCKYYYSVYKELFFFHFVFHASQRRVPAKNNPWATGVRPIYLWQICFNSTVHKAQFSVFEKGA